MSEERHYCLETLKEAKDFLLLAAEKMPKLRAGYDKYKNSGDAKEVDCLAELYKTVNRLKSVFIEIIQSLYELEETQTAQTAQKLSEGVNKFRFPEQDYGKLCGALTLFAKSLPADGEINTAVLGRLMNRVKMGYFPTEESHVEIIKSALSFPKAKVNILDPCCGRGTALKIFTDGENAATYGTELDSYRAQHASEKLDRVGFGSFFHSHISNRSFHCVFLNPPYLSVIKEGGGTKRAERSFLIDILRYLIIDGVLIYIIPYYRLTEDICEILTENFYDIKVYRFHEYEFKKYKQVVIFGRLKQRDTNNKEKAAGLLSLSLNPDAITPISELKEHTYALTGKEIEVKLFKGAKFNVNELAVQLSESKSLDSLFIKSKLDTMHRNPLLPLKVSQIGLIGGSGLMNGLVECEEPHIIKGRIIKESVTQISKDAQNGTEEIRKVISNRMVFNVLTANGFKQLA